MGDWSRCTRCQGRGSNKILVSRGVYAKCQCGPCGGSGWINSVIVDLDKNRLGRGRQSST